MFEVKTYSGDLKKDYDLLYKQLHALLDGETDEITIVANVSALLNQYLEKINWVRFYPWKEDELVRGPFQGLPACTRIPYGRGVCGTSVKEKKTVLVPDVSKFPGHIVCDAASQSEIVIPIFKNDEIYGVLDIDSPILERFDETEQEYLEEFVRIVEQYL